MAELVLGCKPCEDKIAIEGELVELTETAIAAERQCYAGYPVSLSDNNGLRWFQEDNLVACPISGEPCPNVAQINQASEFILRDMRLVLLDRPTAIGEVGLSYLVP